MKSAVRILLVLLLSPLLPLTSEAQCTSGANSCAQAVPHLVKFSGVLKNTLGVPRTGIVAMRFVIYGDETRGTPLWQEVQNVRLDQQGHYEVMLGSYRKRRNPDGVVHFRRATLVRSAGAAAGRRRTTQGAAGERAICYGGGGRADAGRTSGVSIHEALLPRLQS